jgi:uroporphyrinogen decarboxylase
MNKIERVAAVLEGKQPDRLPICFWHHFGPATVSGPKAVEAHIRHVETYDLDFLKVMCDARYPFPSRADGIIEDVADLDRLAPLRGDEDIFGRHLEVLHALSRRFSGELRITTTLFNSWSTLRRLMMPDIDVHGPPSRARIADQRDVKMSGFLAEAPEVFTKALDAIVETLANFARNCLAAGADGIYLSVRDDWVDTAENGDCPDFRGHRAQHGRENGTVPFAAVSLYDRLVREGDLKILSAAAGGTLNMLHVCGTPLDFARFGGYPVHAVNWADRIGGPKIAEVASWLRPAICCGIDNLGTLISGTPAEVEHEVIDAVQQAGGRPIIVAPGCTFDGHAAPAENLRAIRRSVDRLTQENAAGTRRVP